MQRALSNRQPAVRGESDASLDAVSELEIGKACREDPKALQKPAQRA